MPNLDYILGIETSCDETGIAVYHAEQGLVSEVLYSQVETHALYGGVVPELAARDHSRRLLPLAQKALSQANISIKQISGIAYCAGPGLAGALLVGAAAGRTLGWILDKPSIGVNHLEGHLLSVLLDKPQSIEFPFIALLVSGGHTLLIKVNKFDDYVTLGETLDDAAGEAFDKTANILGLGYPGGAALSKLAEDGDPSRFKFPRPLYRDTGLNFSFSGLKTHVSRCWNKLLKDSNQAAHVARGFEEAVTDVLTAKCKRALELAGLNRLVIAGGVSANTRLRERLSKELSNMGAKLYCPAIRFCTDNGAMIAYAGFLKLRIGKKDNLAINIYPRWSIDRTEQSMSQFH